MVEKQTFTLSLLTGFKAVVSWCYRMGAGMNQHCKNYTYLKNKKLKYKESIFLKKKPEQGPNSTIDSLNYGHHHALLEVRLPLVSGYSIGQKLYLPVHLNGAVIKLIKNKYTSWECFSHHNHSFLRNN